MVLVGLMISLMVSLSYWQVVAADRLNNDPTLPMFDRSIAGAYPPGSTYKMITASAALQEGVVNTQSTVYCPGYIEVPTTWNENGGNGLTASAA